MRTIGTLQGLVDANFAKYDGFHKDRSSEVTLLPTKGIVRKDKTGRKDQNALREFFALSIWDRVLGAHRNDDIPIVSPEPIAIDEQGRIYMAFVPGVTGGVVASRAFPQEVGLTRGEKKAVCRDFLVRLGRLFAIKELEGLVHGDFQLRHVLCSISSRTLGVIDVENSCKASTTDANRENGKMRTAIDLTLPKRGRWRTAYLDALDEGRASVEGLDSQIGEIAEQIKTELSIPRISF